MNKMPAVAGFPCDISAKKRRYSSTAVGFPIRNDLSAYLQGISAPFPTWERVRVACTYVRNLGICLHWPKNDLLDAILAPANHAADNADSARHGLQNCHAAPLFVPAYMIGGRTIHHANTTLATPCGASNLSERQCNSLMVGSQLAWELLAIQLNSHWPTIRLTLANYSRPIQLTLANHSQPIELILANYSTHIGKLFTTQPTNPIESNQPNRVKPTQPTQPNQTKPNQPTQPNRVKPTQPTQPNRVKPIETFKPNSTHIGEPFKSHWRTIPEDTNFVLVRSWFVGRLLLNNSTHKKQLCNKLWR